MNSDTAYQNNFVTIFCTTGIAGYRREIYFFLLSSEHPELSVTFVHNILGFHTEYFSETSINDVLKGQSIGLNSWTNFNSITQYG